MDPTSLLRSQRHVLVVEDDHLLRRAIGRTLELEGHRVTLAASVAQARALLDGHDTILLDMELPDGLGSEFLHHLRACKSAARVAVVSAAPDEILDHARELHPDRFFPKPFDVLELLEWVRKG